MRNKCFIYMCKNPSGKMLQGFNKLLEGIFLPPAGCGSVFPMKSYQDAWRNSSWLARGQMNMTDEAKVQRPICSTFEALAVWGAVGHCCGEKLGPFCWPMPAAATAVGMLLVDLLSIRLRCNDFARIQKAVVDQTSRRQPNFGHDLFSMEVLRASSQPHHWVGWYWLS